MTYDGHANAAFDDRDASMPLTGMELRGRLDRLRTIAMVMDTAITIPGTGISFGADSVLGLIPGIGDLAGALVGVVIINEARRLGVPKHKMARMAYNIGVDTVLGSVPLLGDVFDVYFKSHRRNVQMILDHFERQTNR